VGLTTTGAGEVVPAEVGIVTEGERPRMTIAGDRLGADAWKVCLLESGLGP